jgi:sugar lactone lactonase YvrE
MYLKALAIVFSIGFFFTSQVAANGPAPRLEQIWVSRGFSSPEGVAVVGDTLLISNVAGDATEKDGLGWISRVSKEGKILEEKWVEGLNAPKGMAAHNGLLYVADIDTFHTINIETGERLNSYKIQGAGFLNDVTVWNGDVYVSDSARNTIHKLDENGSRPWLTAPILSGVNGLLGQEDRLIVSTMTRGLLLSIDVDGKIEELGSGMIDADGVAALGHGSFLVSSWTGRIWHVGPGGTVTSILETEAEGINQNDLTGVGSLIVVPNWSPGTVTAWRVVTTDGGAN